ncbi:flagellar protein FliT [Pinirhizobacter sp.]|jgi:hypothetical protein|uniref:flagellar protein FliT n=1 Tax=Pinirhizobacter sp. TaxID=2950432 RepID=UPI002F400B49
MSATHHDALRLAVTTSESMLTAASAGDWDAVATLEPVRAEALAQGHPADATSVELLRRMLECNRAIEGHAAMARAEVARKLGQSGQGYRGASAYLAAARS